MDNFVCNTWHMILVAYEIADKLVDLFTANNYKDGNITSNPKESVYIALMVIFSLALPVTVLRVVLYLHRMHLYRSGDDSNDKMHHAINMLMSWAKMLFEAFPQATIALFYFGDCAKTNSTKTMVQAFNTFSIFPFIMFICYAVFFFLPCSRRNGGSMDSVLHRAFNSVPYLFDWVHLCWYIDKQFQRTMH